MWRRETTYKMFLSVQILSFPRDKRGLSLLVSPAAALAGAEPQPGNSLSQEESHPDSHRFRTTCGRHNLMPKEPFLIL